MTIILTNTLKTLTLGIVLAASIHSAQATAIVHTFVSGYGDDGNPCTHGQPCATFAKALANTLPGGVITASDAGDYGSVNITEAVTIDGIGAQASIVVSTGDAIDINAGNGDVVILHHLSLTGVSGANAGIALQTGSLEMDDCHLSGFNDDGIYIGSNGSALVENTSITQCGHGMECDSPGLVSVHCVTFKGNNYGLVAAGGPVDISHSLITQNAVAGLFAFKTTLSVLNCILTGNGTAVDASTSSTIRLTNNDIFNNTTGLLSNSTSGIQNAPVGIISTAGNNRKAGSTTPGAPTPGKIIVIQ